MTPFAHASRSRVVLPLRFFAGVLVVLVAALGLFYVVMRPPFSGLRVVATLLTITAAISLAAGYIAYWSGWLDRLPRLSWTLLGIYALSGLLTLLNVWVTARLMFTSQHDLLLVMILLFFATGIAIVLGSFLSAGLTGRIRTLSLAAQEVAAGRLGVRVPVTGRDEIADLSRAFNDIAAQLARAAERQHTLNALPRDLIMWVGHDLRTPLASVRATVDALADGVVEDPYERQRYLRTAQRDIQVLSGLIDDLFELAQLDAGELQLELRTASIGDLLSATLASFSASAATLGVTLYGSAEPGADPVVMDSSQIGRVLANLVTNALRHTPRGGTVEVRVWPERDEVLVSVRDTGPGISPEDLHHVFDLYGGEKSRSQDLRRSGLGLAIAESIVTAHGGRIWAASAAGAGAAGAGVAGAGATFTCALPRAGRGATV